MAFVYDETNNIFSGVVWSDPTDGGSKAGPITVTQDGLITNGTGTGLTLVANNAVDSYTVTVNGVVSTTDSTATGVLAGTTLPIPLQYSTLSNLTIGTTGQIIGGQYGLYANMPAKIVNNGMISGNVALVMNGQGLNISLENKGVIDDNGGGAIDAKTTGVFTLKNSGTIDGGVLVNSILLSAAGGLALTNSGKMDDITSKTLNDTVTNSGILGNVDLSDGDNIFKSSGTGSGYVGGSGKDSLTLSGFFDGGAALGEGENVISSKLANLNGNVTAGAGNDKLNTSGNVNGSVNLGGGNNVVVIGGDSNGGVTTGSGNDQVTVGKSVNGIVVLGDGDNKLTLGAKDGTSGFSQITTGAGIDVVTITGTTFGPISLGEGKNTLKFKGESNGSITAGSGDDTVTIDGVATSSMNLGDGKNVLTIKGLMTSTVTVGAGDDKITITNNLGSGNDIDAGGGNNTVTAKGDIGKISAGNGNDSVLVEAPKSDDINLGGGNNVLTVKAIVDDVGGDISAGSGDDKMTLTGRFLSLNAGDGNNTISLTGGSVGTITTANGNDKLTINAVVTTTGGLSTGGGADVVSLKGELGGTISLGSGDDKLTTGDGSDIVTDEEGDDVYALGGEDDEFFAVSGNSDVGTDQVDGGANRAVNVRSGEGGDLYDASATAAPMLINLSNVTTASLTSIAVAVGGQASGADTGVDIIKNFECATGGIGSDFLVGNALSNILSGNNSADELHGGDGDDGLDGGLGADFLYGGKGADVLVGGGGVSGNRFVYRAVTDSTVAVAGRDLIVDYDSLDILDFSAFNKNLFAFRSNGVFFTDPLVAQARALETMDGWTLQIDVNGDRRVDMAIDVVDSAHILAWDSSDFDFIP